MAEAVRTTRFSNQELEVSGAPGRLTWNFADVLRSMLEQGECGSAEVQEGRREYGEWLAGTLFEFCALHMAAVVLGGKVFTQWGQRLDEFLARELGLIGLEPGKIDG